MPPLPAADVEAFQRDGWLVVRGLVDAPTLAACVSAHTRASPEAKHGFSSRGRTQLLHGLLQLWR
jgi:hypothetical protein